MIQPLGKRILIKPIIPEKKPTILHLKDESPQSFQVIQIGDEVKKVNINDIIFIAAYSTSELKNEENIYTIVSEDNVIAKIGS